MAPTPPSLTIIISARAALAPRLALTVSRSCCFPPDLTPLLQLLIFLLEGRGLTGEGPWKTVPLTGRLIFHRPRPHPLTTGAPLLS